jgi:hypothetical protein
MDKRVLVVGGTGVFGSRLVRGLITTSRFDVAVGTRDIARARPLLDEVKAGSRATAFNVDRTTVTAEELRASDAFAVVDAAGPFQGPDYRLLKAAIAARLHYVDLADARDFVAGFTRFDPAAREAGVTALTGASSTPALSNAVLDRLTMGWREVDTVEIAISPGNRAPRGLSVIRAILSYAGKPVRVFEDGNWVARPGWGRPVSREIRGLGRRWLSLCETPDLDLVVQRFAVRRTVMFRAGLELPVLHFGVVAAGLAVRLRLVGSLALFARAFRAADRLFRNQGNDRGAMIVNVAGINPEGTPTQAAWTLLAEGGDGPIIPTLPAIAALRALAEGRLNQPGAVACAGIIDLDMIEREFRPYRIQTRIDIGQR